MHGFFGEFIGMFVLIAFGTSACAGNDLKKTHSHHQNWIFVTLAWGLAISMSIYISSIFSPEPHLNPAVTLSYAAFGFFPWKNVLPYILGQFLGAFVGALVTVVLYYPHFKITKSDEGNHIGIFSTWPAIYNPLFNFISEVIATFFFVFSLVNLGDFSQGLKPLIVGLLIVVVGLSFGGPTGFAINPARDFSPRLVYGILPIPNKGDANWKYAWVPICGPIVGAMIAAGLHSVL